MYIAAALKPTISILPTDAQSTEGFETILCELNYNQSALPVLVVYRRTTASAADDSSFFKALEFAAGLREESLIIGDFNGPDVDWVNYVPDYGLRSSDSNLFECNHLIGNWTR